MMKRFILAVVVTGSVMALAGCEEKTKAWFDAHPKESVEIARKCDHNKDYSKECENARWGKRAAEIKENQKKLKERGAGLELNVPN